MPLWRHHACAVPPCDRPCRASSAHLSCAKMQHAALMQREPAVLWWCLPLQVPLVATRVRHGADVPCAPVPLIPVAAGKSLNEPHSLRRGWAHPANLRRDWARPAYICTGTGLTPATFAPGLASVFILVEAGNVCFAKFCAPALCALPLLNRALECARGRAYVRVPYRTRLGPSLCGRCAWA